MEGLSSVVEKVLSSPLGNASEYKRNKTLYEDVTTENTTIDNTLHQPAIERNYTDPKVIHDPSIKRGGIARNYAPQNKVNNDNGDIGTIEAYEQLKTDGIYYPLVMYNHTVLEPHCLKKLYIHYTEIVPTIDLIISDPRGDIKFKNTPSYDNLLTVVIVPPKDGAYKKISLNFYITETSDYGSGNILVHGKWYLKDLYENTGLVAITYPGCIHIYPQFPEFDCLPPPDPKPNTWEFLHTIATKTGLGFACTHMCRDIPDHLPRLQHNTSLIQDLETNIKYAQVDENTIFDYWIDLYGYIVLVNVPWVLNETKYTYNWYDIISTTGLKASDNDTIKQKFVITHRTLTNYKMTGSKSDLSFINYTTKTDLSHQDDGTTTSVITLSQEGSTKGANNACMTTDVSQNQTNIDSISNRAKHDVTGKSIHNIDLTGENMMERMTIRNKFFQVRNSEVITIEMQEVNFGLQRGTIVNIVFYEYDVAKKKKIIDDASNIERDWLYTGTGTKEDVYPDKGEMKIEQLTRKDILEDETIGIPDLSRYGLYYITGMDFTYDYESGDLKQFVHVIKKGMTTKYSNFNTIPKFTPTAFGTPGTGTQTSVPPMDTQGMKPN